MKEKLILLAILTAAPLIALGVSLGSQWRFQSQWEELIRREVPDVDQATLKDVTIERVCSDPKLAAGLGEACATLEQLHLVSVCAGVALGAGILLPLIISVAGALAKHNRRLLLSVFGPGLYMTNIAVAGLVAIHSILIIAAGWYGMTVLLERISLKMLLVLGLIGLGALIGAFQIVSSLRGRFRKASAAVVGKAVSQQDAPNLWNEVKALSAAAGTAPPSHLVVGLDPNFFVTEADVRCVEANLTGRTMYLSLPLCRILSVEELRAVVSHELGHFHGADTEFSLHFYPIYRGAVDSYDAAASVAYDSEGSVNWALLPALAVLGHFLRSFSSAESRISRDRELLADRFAAELVSEDAVASALVKIHAYSDYWDAVIEMMRQSLQEGSISIGGQTYDVERFFANLSLLFATVASSFTSSISLDSLGEHRIPHPTDSHPPLTVRLEALNRTVEHVAQNALDVTPADAAITLIDGHEKLETALSALQKLIVHPQLAEQQLAAS